MDMIASQITSLTIVYSTVYSDADQRKHQSSASLAFVWWIHRVPVNSPHKWPVTRKMFPFDDVIIHCISIAHRICARLLFCFVLLWLCLEFLVGSCGSGIILDIGLSNERRRYDVTSSLIVRAHTQNYTLMRYDVMMQRRLLLAEPIPRIIPLQCNVVSHWLSPYPEWFLWLICS